MAQLAKFHACRLFDYPLHSVAPNANLGAEISQPNPGIPADPARDFGRGIAYVKRHRSTETLFLSAIESVPGEIPSKCLSRPANRQGFL